MLCCAVQVPRIRAAISQISLDPGALEQHMGDADVLRTLDLLQEAMGIVDTEQE